MKAKGRPTDTDKIDINDWYIPAIDDLREAIGREIEKGIENALKLAQDSSLVGERIFKAATDAIQYALEDDLVEFTAEFLADGDPLTFQINLRMAADDEGPYVKFDLRDIVRRAVEDFEGHHSERIKEIRNALMECVAELDEALVKAG